LAQIDGDKVGLAVGDVVRQEADPEAATDQRDRALDVDDFEGHVPGDAVGLEQSVNQRPVAPRGGEVDVVAGSNVAVAHVPGPGERVLPAADEDEAHLRHRGDRDAGGWLVGLRDERQVELPVQQPVQVLVLRACGEPETHRDAGV